jgi:hypothetical protein
MRRLHTSLPEDALWLRTAVDSSGRPLEGRHRYTLAFTKRGEPPVNAFWSITMYNARHELVENPLGRHLISGASPIHIQAQSPGPSLERRWLPTPTGEFNLVMRLYSAGETVIAHRWTPPSIERVD